VCVFFSLSVLLYLKKKIISFGGEIFTPCQFERHAGKSTSRNWKSSIRCCGRPLSAFIESYETNDGKK